MREYIHTGPIDCNKPINVENLNGKTAIVTGGASYWYIEIEYGASTDYMEGANGLGEAYVRALVAVGYETMSEKRSVT